MHPDFNDFMQRISDKQAFHAEVQTVIQKEHDTNICELFQKVDITEILKEVAIQQSLIPVHGIEMLKTRGKRISVFAAIRDRWITLQQLAKDGNLGFGLADITDPHVVKILQTLPEFAQLTSIVYLSNIIDHITHRGTEFGVHLKNLHAINSLIPLVSDNTYFVDTTQMSLGQWLRINNRLPVYTRRDFTPNLFHYITPPA